MFFPITLKHKMPGAHEKNTFAVVCVVSRKEKYPNHTHHIIANNLIGNKYLNRICFQCTHKRYRIIFAEMYK